MVNTQKSEGEQKTKQNKTYAYHSLSPTPTEETATVGNRERLNQGQRMLKGFDTMEHQGHGSYQVVLLPQLTKYSQHTP